MNPMNPMNQKYVDLCKDTNISCEQILERFDLNLTRISAPDYDNGRRDDENPLKTLDVLSTWLEDALAQGMSIEELQPRAKKLAQCAFDKGCTKEEVTDLLTMHPRGI